MKRAYILLAAVAMVSLTACGGIRRGLGMEKAVPDEFAVVSKAPLVLPPEYSLLPPRPGEPRPQEIDSAASARQALFGAVPDSGQSQGEETLAAMAGGTSADPAIRATIERETAGVSFKSESFADRILFWQGDDDYDIRADPLDPDAEAERLRRQEAANEVTGGQPVEIEAPRGGFKLPGL